MHHMHLAHGTMNSRQALPVNGRLPEIRGIRCRPEMAGTGCRPEMAGTGCRPEMPGIRCRPEMPGIGRRPEMPGTGWCPESILGHHGHGHKECQVAGTGSRISVYMNVLTYTTTDP